MYLSRLILNPRNRAVRKDMADCQSLHQTIMRAFPQGSEDAAKCARARFGVLHRLEMDPHTGRIALYVQSQVAPDWTGLARDYLLQLPGVENPSCKSLSEQYARIREGMVLRFRLRANPTKKVDTRRALVVGRRNGCRVGLNGEEELARWLERKAVAGGFNLLDLVIHRSGAEARVSGNHPAGAMVFRAVVFEGRLVVTDRERFHTTLASGVGSGKAYGFGLLSVAPGVV